MINGIYLPYYSLREKPFSVTSDPSFIYLGRKHQEALDHLIFGIENRVGFIAITGEVGTGKTTLCRLLLNRLGNKVKSAFIFNPNMSEIQFMKSFMSDLGLATEDKNRHELFSDLNRFLIEELQHDHNVVLIIDEAQNLRVPLMEQIRMLSNLETEKEKLLQIILVGQPELEEKLNLPKLRQLKQRINVHYRILPLEREDLRPYIEHRLNVAGANGNAPHFDELALDMIYAYSKGIPRLINQLCDRTLLLGFTNEVRRFTDETVKRALVAY